MGLELKVWLSLVIGICVVKVVKWEWMGNSRVGISGSGRGSEVCWRGEGRYEGGVVY